MRLRYLFAVLLSVGFAVFYSVGSESQILVISSDILFVIVSGACAALSFVVLRKWGIKGKMGFARLGLFLGILLWFLGEFGWAVIELGMNVPVPYPSAADIFYLCGYVPLAAGIARLLWIFKDLLDRTRVSAAAIVGAVPTALATIFVLSPLYTESADQSTKFFDVAYPVLDLVILVLCILMISIFRGGLMAKSWLWITFGIALTTVADLLFIQGTLAGWYYSGHPSELPYLWGYVSLGVGFQAQRTELG